MAPNTTHSTLNTSPAPPLVYQALRLRHSSFSPLSARVQNKTAPPAACCCCCCPTPQALTAQRSRGTDLAALQSFSYSSLQDELQVGGVFIRVFNQRGRSSANASNATVTAATATAAVAPAAAAAAGAAGTHPGPLSQQPQQQRGSAGGAAAGWAAGAGAASGVPSDPSGFCKALVRYLYGRLVERCFRGTELQQLPAAEAQNVLDVVTALSGGNGWGGVR
jgi:hypothetical protein